MAECDWPSIAWSSSGKKKAFLYAAIESKLPLFSDALSQFEKGASSGDQIKNFKSQHENRRFDASLNQREL